MSNSELLTVVPRRWASRTAVWIVVCAFGCGDDAEGTGRDDGSSGEVSSAESKKLLVELSVDETMRVCERELATWADATGDRNLECEISALAFATEFGTAPFSRSTCGAERSSCWEELGETAASEELSDCQAARLAYQKLATCDVTVGEWEACTRKRAEWYGSVSCETPDDYAYDKAEEIDTCWESIWQKCDSDLEE